MRASSVALVLGIVIAATAGCAGGAGSADRLGSDEYEQVRDDAQKVSDRAITAVARAIGVQDEADDQPLTVTSCSGAPEGYVRLGAGEAFIYPGGSAPAGADAEIEQAWTDLGLAVARRGDKLVGEMPLGGGELTIGLSDAIEGGDGSGRELRRVGIESTCFDVGPDRARDVTR